MGSFVPEEVDIIIVGGGVVGSVIAARLANAAPSLQILLIEAGKDNRNNPAIYTPALFLGNFREGNPNVEEYLSNYNENLGRRTLHRAGQVLGGGSSVNVLMYSRPAASDFDEWQTQGWAFKDLEPYFKKFETYHGDGTLETHGSDGPVEISMGSTTSALIDQFKYAVKSYSGWDATDDIWDFKTVNKVAKLPKFISSKDGRRTDAATAYLQPIRDTHKNLHLLLETKVTRVLFQWNRAVGVEYVSNKLANPDSDQTVRSVRSRKMVVLSAGTLATPQILQRSAIGDPSKLLRVGISDIVAELPGVGLNFHEHPYQRAAISFVDVQSSDTADDLFRLDPESLAQLQEEFEKEGGGPLAGNFADVGMKYRPTEEEIKTMGPEWEDVWKEYFAPNPDRPLMMILLLNVNSMPRNTVTGEEAPKGRFISMVVTPLYSFSRGHIHITSTTDIYSTPDFDAAMLSNPLDIKAHILGYKRGREIIRRMPCFRGEWKDSHPPFPIHSTAAHSDDPVKPIRDYVYSKEDDEIIEQWIRGEIVSMNHPMGTCAMKPREKGGVVDKDLNVHLTTNLKIADMSITPGWVGANTAATAFAIGEKAAVIIANELGIVGV